LTRRGELVIGPLIAEALPAEVAELREELTALLPFTPIVSVFIELDRNTGFLDCYTHAGVATPRSRELKRNLLAVIVAQATNLGLARMADASGIGYDTPSHRVGSCLPWWSTLCAVCVEPGRRRRGWGDRRIDLMQPCPEVADHLVGVCGEIFALRVGHVEGAPDTRVEASFLVPGAHEEERQGRLRGHPLMVPRGRLGGVSTSSGKRSAVSRKRSVA
jgi:hypothetical protein